MKWHRIGDKLFSEPMVTRFADAYMRHGALILIKINEFNNRNTPKLMLDGIVVTVYIMK